MSTLSLAPGSRRGALSVRTARRSRGFALACESLEARQLLSVFPAPAALDAVSASVIAQPHLPVTPLAAKATPMGLSPQQLRTAYGVNNLAFRGGIQGDG